MAGSMNEVNLIGLLGADPEVRRTQDGRPIVNLRVATEESWRDKTTGERKSKSEWHRCVIFQEGLCRIAEQYLKKGSKVLLRGQLQTRKWTNQQGQDQYSTEVVLQGFDAKLILLDGKGGGQQGGQAQPGGYGMADPNQGPNDNPAGGYGGQRQQGGGGFGGGASGGGHFDKDLDDDIPF
jgi:single-strand DNA-binding protein